MLDEVDNDIDRKLVSPSDPDIDFKGCIKNKNQQKIENINFSELVGNYLPALMSVGAGLGVALHTALTRYCA